MPWWNRCSSDAAVMTLDTSNSGAFTRFAGKCGKHYTGGGGH